MKKNIKCRKIQEPDSSNLDSQIKTRKYIDSDNNSLEIENYIQDEIDAQIAEYDTLNSLEDIYTSVIMGHIIATRATTLLQQVNMSSG